MAQGISAKYTAIFLHNIHLFLTVPPVEGDLPELLVTVYVECGDLKTTHTPNFKLIFLTPVISLKTLK